VPLTSNLQTARADSQLQEYVDEQLHHIINEPLSSVLSRDAKHLKAARRTAGWPGQRILVVIDGHRADENRARHAHSKAAASALQKEVTTTSSG
jgi:hypothetical protein